MGVFMRTGDNMAVGFSWPVYLFVILPFQLLVVWPLKLLFWIGKGCVWACIALYGLIQAARHEERPPAA